MGNSIVVDHDQTCDQLYEYNVPSAIRFPAITEVNNRGVTNMNICQHSGTYVPLPSGNSVNSICSVLATKVPFFVVDDHELTFDSLNIMCLPSPIRFPEASMNIFQQPDTYIPSTIEIPHNSMCSVPNMNVPLPEQYLTCVPSSIRFPVQNMPLDPVEYICSKSMYRKRLCSDFDVPEFPHVLLAKEASVRTQASEEDKGIDKINSVFKDGTTAILNTEKAIKNQMWSCEISKNTTWCGTENNM